MEPPFAHRTLSDQEELGNVPQQIAKETLATWKFCVRRGQEAVAKSHRESLIILIRAGISIDSRSVAEHLADLLFDQDEADHVREASGRVFGELCGPEPPYPIVREKIIKRLRGIIRSTDGDKLLPLVWKVLKNIAPEEFPIDAGMALPHGAIETLNYDEWARAIPYLLEKETLSVPDVREVLTTHLRERISDLEAPSTRSSPVMDAFGIDPIMDALGMAVAPHPTAAKSLVEKIVRCSGDDGPGRLILRDLDVSTFESITLSPSSIEKLTEWISGGGYSQKTTHPYSDGPAARDIAAPVLSKFAPSNPKVLKTFSSCLEHHVVRADAVEALMRADPTDLMTEKSLIKQLNSEKVRQATAEAFRQNEGLPQPDLVKTLTDRGKQIGDAVEVLKWTHAKCLPVIKEKLEDESPSTRVSAVKALSKISLCDASASNLKDLTETLTELLYDEAEVVRRASADALRVISPSDLRIHNESIEKIKARIIKASPRASESDKLPPVAMEVCIAAAEVLEKAAFRKQRAGEALNEFLESENTSARSAAATVLSASIRTERRTDVGSKYGAHDASDLSSASVDALIERVANGPERFSRAAEGVLENTNPPDINVPLIKCLRSYHPSVASVIRQHSPSRLDATDDMVDALCELFGEKEDHVVHEDAADAIGKIVSSDQSQLFSEPTRMKALFGALNDANIQISDLPASVLWSLPWRVFPNREELSNRRFRIELESSISDNFPQLSGIPNFVREVESKSSRSVRETEAEGDREFPLKGRGKDTNRQGFASDDGKYFFVRWKSLSRLPD